jgi:hypothetical protein
MAKIAIDWTQKTTKADRDQKDEVARALKALAETDWYVLRLVKSHRLSGARQEAEPECP